jgi:hypothetical protein
MKLRALPVFGVSAAMLVAGCGGGTHYADKNKPAPPINLTAVVNDQAISASPASFGAGPVVFYVSNEGSQTETLSIVKLSTEKIVADTGPINPGTPSQVQVNFTPGEYAVVANGKITPANLHVGKSRANGDGVLLEP